MLYIDFIEKKLDFFSRNAIVSLFIIGGMALFLRLYFFEEQLPVTDDALAYFWYANDLSISGKFPNYVANNGWPTFLSILFSVFHFNNILDYMILQRVVSISISALTMIPVYLLCTRFFEKSYSLVGTSLFVLEPQIAKNSLLGITEPLYIFLITIATFLFLSTNKKTVYISFGIIALSTLVRSEGVILFLVFSILFFIRYRREQRVIMKYVPTIIIFVLILLPMVIIRIQTGGEDAITSRILGGVQVVSSSLIPEENAALGTTIDLKNGVVNLTRFLGLSMASYFALFVPFGSLLIFKNRDYIKTVIILTMTFLLIPAFYAFSQISDTRYLFPLYPFFSILSIFTIKTLVTNIIYRNIFLILLIFGILLISWYFVYSHNIDVEHEKEALSLARYVANTTTVINQYLPESKYIALAGMADLKSFPVLKSEFKEPAKPLKLEANSLEEYIKLGKERGLTHLVLDGTKNRPNFLNDVFFHEEKYPYLLKEFDSFEHGYKYHLKIYKIDYRKFESM